MKIKKDLTMDALTKDVPFEDVLPLITPMIKRMAFDASRVYGLEQEDLEQEFSLKAFLSWQSWNPGHGTKFSTYVYDALTKHRNHLIRGAKAQCRNGGTRPISLDGLNDSGRDGDTYQLYDFCKDKSGMDMDQALYLAEMEESIEKVISTMNKRAQLVIRDLINGQTQETVGARTGIAQSVISYYWTTFRVKVREEFERKDFDLPLEMKKLKTRSRSSKNNPEPALETYSENLAVTCA